MDEILWHYNFSGIENLVQFSTIYGTIAFGCVFNVGFCLINAKASYGNIACLYFSEELLCLKVSSYIIFFSYSISNLCKDDLPETAKTINATLLAEITAQGQK